MAADREPARFGAPDDDGRVRPADVVERACMVLSACALLAMLVLVGLDIVTRSLFNFSYEVSDEVGGYMLVALAFLSLSVCYRSGSFHQVEFIQERLSEAGRLVSRLFFGLLILGVASVFLWQSVRLVRSSWRFGDLAPTYLATPLWLPRLVLAVGMAALCLTVIAGLAADVGRLRRLRAARGRRRNGP